MDKDPEVEFIPKEDQLLIQPLPLRAPTQAGTFSPDNPDDQTPEDDIEPDGLQSDTDEDGYDTDLNKRRSQKMSPKEKRSQSVPIDLSDRIMTRAQKKKKDEEILAATTNHQVSKM